MTGLPCSVLLIALGAVGAFGAIVVATGNQKGESNPAGFVGLGFMLLLGVLGVFLHRQLG
jgi:ABC-type sulfate transport system permease subunit